MKILLNGVYVGGNCPPFYSNLKTTGHDVKIIDVCYFNNAYTNFSKVIEQNDIIIPPYNLVDFILFKLYTKTKFNFLLFTIVNRLNKIIAEHNPDVIINHQMSLNCNVMLETKFKPQVGFIYGSEIKGENINKLTFKTALKQISKVITTTPKAKEEIINKYQEAAPKITTISWSNINEDVLINVKSKIDLPALYLKYDLKQTDFIIYDNRSLRNSEITKQALSGYCSAINTSSNIKIILVKGFSGKSELVHFAEMFVAREKKSKSFIIINEEISEDDHLKFLACSNAVTSFLRNDQFGEVIMQAMFFKKYLILYNLPQYREVLGTNALYVDESAQSIAEKIKLIQQQQIQIDLDLNYNNVITNFEVKKAFNKINQLLTQEVLQANQYAA